MNHPRQEVGQPGVRDFGLLQAKVHLSVEHFPSRILGGDIEVAVQVVDAEIDAAHVIADPLGQHRQRPKIQTRLGIGNVQSAPPATKIAAANFLLSPALLLGQARNRAGPRACSATLDPVYLDHSHLAPPTAEADRLLHQLEQLGASRFRGMEYGRPGRRTNR